MSQTEIAHIMEEQSINDARQKEEEDNALTALHIFESGLSKSAIKVMANNAVHNVMETGNVFQVAEALSAMENFIKEVKGDERFKNYTREETAKYPKGYRSPSGVKIECAEVGTSYDFSKCNDGEYFLLEQNLKAAENNLKEREKFLKTVPVSGINVVDPTSGEVSLIYPPSKSSSSSYKVTLSK